VIILLFNSIIFFVIIYVISFLIVYGIYKFLISDFFVKKTGYRTYCIKDNKKKCTDIVYIIFAFLMILNNLIMCYLYHIIFDGLIFFYASLLVSLFWAYVLIGIFLRIKYHFYINEEKRPCDRQYKRDFVDFGINWGFLLSFSLMLYGGMSLIMPKTIDLLIILIWFIFLNIAIFPDYLNKIWIKDIRSPEGNYYLSAVFNLMQIISVYIVFIY